MSTPAEPVTDEYDGEDVYVSPTHPSFNLAQHRLRIREFVFTRKDDAIFEAALREKYPDMIVLVEHQEPILRCERVANLLADNQHGQRWIVIPDVPHWIPLVEIVSQPDSPRSRARLRNLPGRGLVYRAGGDRCLLAGAFRPADDWEMPGDPWYRRLKAEVEAKYGVDFGLPPDDGEYSTP